MNTGYLADSSKSKFILKYYPAYSSQGKISHVGQPTF